MRGAREWYKTNKKIVRNLLIGQFDKGNQCGRSKVKKLGSYR